MSVVQRSEDNSAFCILHSLDLLRHNGVCPLTKYSTKNLIVQFIQSCSCVSARLNFDFWMLDATKGKTRVVAVLRVLRHEEGYPLTKSSAKKQSLTIVVPHNKIQILLFSQKIFQLITRFGNKN